MYRPAWVILAVGIHAPRGIAAPAFTRTLRSRRGRQSASDLPDVPAGDGAAASLAGTSRSFSMRPESLRKQIGARVSCCCESRIAVDDDWMASGGAVVGAILLVLEFLTGANIRVASISGRGWEDRGHGFLVPLSRRAGSSRRACP